MDVGQPSRTALATAAARAAHLVVDRPPWIFEDRLAAPLLGERADELLAVHRDPRDAAPLAAMRVAMATRSRYAEGRLLEAASRGVVQCVLLGAGLDSFAYRSPFAERLRVFEVDHPATQAWKRERLAQAAVPIGDEVRFVAVDFTVDSLAARLLELGFDTTRPACGMTVVDDVGRREQVDGPLWRRSDALRPHRLGRIAHARVEGGGQGLSP